MNTNIEIRGWRLWVWMLLGLTVAVATHATEPIGGKEIPTPFQELNRRVELAHGEKYLLTGWVRFIKDSVYFEIDLEEHPWLAHQRRVEYPYYFILNYPVARKDLKDARVWLRVEARGMVRRWDDPSRAEYQISLRMIDIVTQPEIELSRKETP